MGNSELFKGFKSPCYTQTPNDFFDVILPQVDSMAELKVLLCAIRHTLGWHKEQDAISYTQFERDCGMLRQAVMHGLKACIARGTLQIAGKGKQGVIYYKLVISEPEENESCMKITQEENSTSVKITPETSVKITPTKEREKKEIQELSDTAVSSSTALPVIDLSEDECFFLSSFGRKRFATKAQRDAVLALSVEVGSALFRGAVLWAAEKGICDIHAVQTAARKMSSGGKNGPKGSRTIASKYSAYSDPDAGHFDPDGLFPDRAM
jgi:hypothetical protein